MKLNQIIEVTSKRLTVFTFGVLCMFFSGFNAEAQRVSLVQDFSYGSFITFGQGGTITVSSEYIVTKTGDIILKSIPTPAIFDLYVESGKTVQMTYAKNVTMVGDSGVTIILALIDPSLTGNGSIVTGPSPTRVILGGIMTIGSASVSPVGKYSGHLQVDFTVIY
jgi:hypothetical protein